MYVKVVEQPIRHAATGMAISMFANKISWSYNFRRPSAQIDTACESERSAFGLSEYTVRRIDHGYCWRREHVLHS